MDDSIRGKRRPPLIEAMDEIRQGWSRRELWLALGWRDVLSRYRRSLLGPFLITINMGFIAAVMGTLYSAILGRPSHEYIPYLVIGFVVWNLLSALITDGCQVFTANAAAIREIPAPNMIYVFRMLWRNLLIFLHNAIIYLIIVLIFRLWPTPALLFFPLALMLVFLNGIWISILFGLINTRYRDFGPLVGNATRLVFFVTPVIWYADSAGVRSAFVYLNPIYYFVEILRAPLLGHLPGLHVWVIVLLITALGLLATLSVYPRFSRRIIYWI